MPQQDDTLEKRVARLEALLERAISKAQTSPVGRKVLEFLGLS